MLSRPSSILISILAISSTITGQGSQGYFNGSAFAILENTLSPQERIAFSFRSCSSGHLLYQEGRNRNFFSVLLNHQGQLEVRWKTDESENNIYFGIDLANNRWHNVDFIYNLGSLKLYIDSNSILIANSTYNSDLFRINLQEDRPNLYVGKNFLGCILEGPNVVLSFSVQSSSVVWNNCPMPEEDCDNLCGWAFYNYCQNGGSCQEDRFRNNTECICQPKFVQQNCEMLRNLQYCDSSPCQNGGSCFVNLFQHTHSCICHEGFTGNNCEVQLDHCYTNSCKNNGICIDQNGTYTCDCNGTGYRGAYCHININECEELSPCLHESTCYDQYGDYVCHCRPGYGNKTCGDDIDECISSPCENGGTCINFPSRYECRCSNGFTGVNCEMSIDDCSGSICEQNSSCVDTINGHHCMCSPGFRGIYPHCSEINECSSNPCQNGGTCLDKINGFLCSCNQGFTGSQCELNASGCSSNLCQNGGRCIDGIGSYTCDCAPGYIGHNCETNRNECLTNPCVNSIKCEDLVNDYHCDCLSGWEGKNCDQNVDECISQPCLHGTCNNHHNNYSCICQTGYSGLNCEINIDDCQLQPCQNGGTCEDRVNDFKCICTSRFMGKFCSEMYDACYSMPCLNGATCHTNPPSMNFHCTCHAGFKGKLCEINIDDCKDVICPSGQTCFDLINGHECKCPEGFSGNDCSIDVDECLSNPCINGTCVNLSGGYTCTCPDGITGKHCEEDINECDSSPCTYGICKNKHGSYLCYCMQGYTGHHCHIEFDECLSNPCQNNGTCFDQVSNYRCNCIPGFTGRDCENDINECFSLPCVNGGTCEDEINNYKCRCVPGFTGINCEINIDECESSPCLNSGYCIDLINKYVCNCSDTGFTGEICEINIDDCQLNPCQHGSLCEDLIKDYNCDCYQGFSGKNCEHDFPDCLPNPCYNNGLCLENSNQTLYDVNFRGLFPVFSYSTAHGYLCICPDGFTGTNCETNIDDCEVHQCINGTCIDEINNYHCNCSLGFEGKYCDQNIDECLKFMPCQNGGSCIDMIADYTCQCPSEYGGKNCGIELLGCRNNKCKNGATCIPYLNYSGQHHYKCHCPSGFYGDHCNIITTVSFGSYSDNPTSWHLIPEIGNSLSEIGNAITTEKQYMLAFQFRTTLHNGFLVKGKTIESTYLLYLRNGAIHLSIFNNHVLNKTLISEMGLNDAEWKDVVLIIKQNSITLNVAGEVKQEDIIFDDISFIQTFIGNEHTSVANFSILSGIPDFIGCIQDVKLENQVMIPQSNSSSLLGGKIGCDRKTQCNSDTCYNGGNCIDKWNSYSCSCPRSFFGMNCQYNYSPATFGVNNTIGWTKAEINEADKEIMKYFVNIGLKFRTRKDNGLLFDLTEHDRDSDHYSVSSPSNFKAFIQNSNLHVVMQLKDSFPINVTLYKKVDDGDYHFLHVVRNNSLFQVKIDDDDEETYNVSSSNALHVNVLYIGSYPFSSHHIMKRHAFDNNDFLISAGRTGQIIESNQLDHGYFKGIIKDMKVNDKIVEFFPLEVSNVSGLPEILHAVNNKFVKKGEISDDPCNLYSPCKQNAQCIDEWNEYRCNCPENYRGKNCSDLQPCANNPNCPPKSSCHNLFNGYECVAAAAFDGHSKIEFVATIATVITNITFSYRTLDHGVLFSIWDDYTTFTLALNNNSIDLICQNCSQAINKTVINFGNDMVDGKEHRIIIIFSEYTIAWNNNTMFNLTSDDDNFNYMISNNTKIIVGQSSENSFTNFKGCINEFRINNILLPFVSYEHVNTDFDLKNTTAEVGCLLCWDKQCKHKKSCEDKENSFNCNCGGGYKGRNCEIDICDDENPCKHNRSCIHRSTGIICDCGPDYEGSFCETMVDHCVSEPCQNNGTCHNTKPGFNCNCTESFEGKLCEISKIKDCKSNPCKNGGTCLDKDIDSLHMTFQCLCHRNYTGVTCENEVDFCQNNPCANGATCKSDVLQATFKCICPIGYEGINCSRVTDECLSHPCKHGNCTSSFRNYTCLCHHGYMGTNCELQIISCNQKPDLCNNGNCTNGNNSYNCTCNKGYHGRHCILIDQCYPVNPCEDNKKCIRIGNEIQNYTTYKCECDQNDNRGRCGISAVAEGDGTDYAIIIGIIVGCIFFLSIFIGVVMFLRVAKKKRATRGTYSPSRQEMYGSRVEMNHVMKPPPEERLI